MSLAIAPTDIANLALSLMKENAVADIEMPEGEKVASAMNRWWHVTRQACLEDVPLNAARKRSALPLSATAPVFGYTDAYPLPNDFVSLLFIDDETKPLSYWDYSLEDGRILVDNSGAVTLNVGYVFDLEDVYKMPSTFKLYLATRLAYYTCRELTGNGTTTAAIQRLLPQAMFDAKAKNGQQNPPRVYRESKMLIGRRLYGGA